MMKYFKEYLILLLYAISFSACEHATTNLEVVGHHVLRVERFSYDSVYAGEPLYLIGKNFGSDPKLLRLFVGTTSVNFTLASDTSIFIDPLPQGLEGAVRLYKSDSLAKGTLRVPYFSGDFRKVLESCFFSPGSGYTGDHFIIVGSGIPTNRRAVDVYIGGKRLPIDSITSTTIYARISAEVTTGGVSMRIANHYRGKGEFIKLVPEGRFLAKEKLLKFEVYRLIGTRRLQQTTILTTNGSSIIQESVRDSVSQWKLSFPSSKVSREGSYITISGESMHSNIERREVEATFLEDTASSRVSGSIKFKCVNLTDTLKSFLYSIMVENLRWRKTSYGYSLFCFGPSVKENIQSVLLDSVGSSAERPVTTSTLQYLEPDDNAVMELYFDDDSF